MMLPPYAALLGATLETDANGAPLVAVPFGTAVLGRPGFLHGGAIAGLLEIAARAALDHALAGSSVTVAPVTVTIDYRRGGRERRSVAAGTVLRLGARIATVDAIVWQDDRTAPIAGARIGYRLVRG